MKLPFEKIYCLHLAEANERYTNVLKECERIDLENEVNFWYTTKKPINVTIGDCIETLHTPYYKRKMNVNPYTYAACFDCAYNNYSIIKQAYIRGINSILIFEDDIKFNEDVNLLKDIVDNIPSDYDVIRLHNTCYDKNNKIENGVYFELLDEDNCKHYYHSTVCYALSRKGMKALIDKYETKLQAADNVLDSIRLNEDIKFYILKLNVFCTYQDMKSTIVE